MAEAGDAVLLFEEADALFERRTEGGGAEDRYSNMLVSFLLQRIEAFQGVAILTTNSPSSIEPAFMRRCDSVIEFAPRAQRG